jgi:nucleoside-diphosphate-sugar epimerase
MDILVAGGAGFIGSHLCRSLLQAGHAVHCLDNLSTGTFSNIEVLGTESAFHFIEGDVARADSLRVDAIIHLASPASPVDYDRMPLETMSANSLGTWRLIDIAREVGARLLFVSTSEVYGDPLVHPQPETYWGNVDPNGPRSCYDESKRFGEALLFSARRQYGIRANVVRLFNTYGPRMRANDGRAIPEMVSAALDGRPLKLHGDGTQTRSFCYVSDLVEGLLHVLLDPTVDGEVFNLGNPAEITMLTLAEQILRLVEGGGSLEFSERRPGDPERRRPVIQKIQDRYGWTPTVDLEEGLRLTIASFAAARGARPDPRPVGAQG